MPIMRLFMHQMSYKIVYVKTFEIGKLKVGVCFEIGYVT